ncbi:hypothetical protein [Sphingobacterium bovisgrunnientis]|uniref:hypothetical protein n=1 Tax=Sphingobacterium bovisgrunnientis TaxID=1874697 RepID=UPI00135747EB|nr:hypothetical protein [Sphingobacterium bovisgrunnientis]
MSINNVKNEINISDTVIDFLKSKDIFKNDEIHFVTGKQQRPSRTKLILVNTLFAMQDEDDNEIIGSLNVNIQDEDTIWIEYIGEILNLFLDESIIGNYRLEFTNEHLFKVSKDLYFKNLKFKFTSI